MQREKQYPLPKPMTLDLHKEDRISMPGGTYRFIQGISYTRLLFHHEITGHERVMTEREVAELLGNGKARRIADPRKATGAPKSCASNKEVPIDVYDTPEGIRARSLQFYVKEWDRDPRATLGKKWIGDFLVRMRPHALRHHLTSEFGPSRIIEAIHKCGAPGDRQLRYFISQRGKSSRGRLHPRVETLLQETVNWYYDYRNRTKKDAATYFEDLMRAENATRRKQHLQVLEMPKRHSTLNQRINFAECHANWSRKFSKWEADQVFRGVADHLSASAPGEIVIIDHTVVDSFVLIDEKTLLPLGRPYLSIAIDVYTRCILGFLVTAEPPSIYSVTTLMKRVNQPKFYLADLYPEIEGTWDSYIHPLVVLCDNGWDLGSVSVVEALSDIGTELIFAPIATPQYKAIGERAFKTFNTGLIHKLPGSIPYNLAQRRHLAAQKLDVDPHKDAIVTIGVLERLIHEFIVVYENEHHSGVGAIPARLWQDGLLLHPRRVIDDINSLDHILGKVDQAQLTKAGIKFENMRFHDQENVTKLLNDLVGREPLRSQAKSTHQSGRVKVKIKYNPADATRIYAWHSVEGRYYPLFNRDKAYSEGLSFWAAKQIHKFAREKDMEFKSDEQRSIARARLQKTIEKLIPKKPLKASSEARRLLAQALPTLENGRVEFAQAASTIDGRSAPPAPEASIIPIDVFGNERVDGNAPRPGVLKNPQKQKQTRAANKKAREQERTDQATNGALPSTSVEYGHYVVPRRVAGSDFKLPEGDGWGAS